MTCISKVRFYFTIYFIISYLHIQFIKYIVNFNYYFNQCIQAIEFQFIIANFFLYII